MRHNINFKARKAAVTQRFPTRRRNHSTYRKVLPVTLLLLNAQGVAHADELIHLSSPEQGWALQFEGPAITPVEETSSVSRYRFYGKTAEGFFLSLHVEPLLAEEISPQSCWAKYHAGGWNLPDFVDKSSFHTVVAAIPEVHYSAVIRYKERSLSMPNSHYYFTVNGYCADLHLASKPLVGQPVNLAYEALAKRLKSSLVISAGLEASRTE